jgi:low affinity Fe/Cu permease
LVLRRAPAWDNRHGGIDAMSRWFTHFAQTASRLSGHYLAFTVALAIVLVWAVAGPIFKFSETWQLVINTGTTIITFLMVFLVQNSQNRDSAAIHVKLDEIIRSLESADNTLMSAEEDTEEQLEQIRSKYEAMGGGQ